MELLFKQPSAGLEAFDAPTCQVIRIETEVFTMASYTIDDVTEIEEDW